jgi:hypothetical protein
MLFTEDSEEECGKKCNCRSGDDNEDEEDIDAGEVTVSFSSFKDISNEASFFLLFWA